MRRSAHAGESAAPGDIAPWRTDAADAAGRYDQHDAEGLHAFQDAAYRDLRRNKLELNGGPVVGRMKRTNDCFRPRELNRSLLLSDGTQPCPEHRCLDALSAC